MSAEGRFVRLRLWHVMTYRYQMPYISFLTWVNSALHPSGVAKSSTSFGWGKGRNVASAGWQVTLCDPIWYASSRSGDGRLACKLLYPSLLLLFFTYSPFTLWVSRWDSIMEQTTSNNPLI